MFKGNDGVSVTRLGESFAILANFKSTLTISSSDYFVLANNV